MVSLNFCWCIVVPKLEPKTDRFSILSFIKEVIAFWLSFHCFWKVFLEPWFLKMSASWKRDAHFHRISSYHSGKISDANYVPKGLQNDPKRCKKSLRKSMRFCIGPSIDFGSKMEAKWSHKWSQKPWKKEQNRDPLPMTRPWRPNGCQRAPKWSQMRAQGRARGGHLEARGS